MADKVTTWYRIALAVAFCSLLASVILLEPKHPSERGELLLLASWVLTPGFFALALILAIVRSVRKKRSLK